MDKERKQLPSQELEETADFGASSSVTSVEEIIRLNKSNTKNRIDNAKSIIISITLLSSLIGMSIIIGNRGLQIKSLTNDIRADNTISPTERRELIDEKESTFYDNSLAIFSSIFIATVSYFVGTKTSDEK